MLFDLRYPFNGSNEADLFGNIEKTKELNFKLKGNMSEVNKNILIFERYLRKLGLFYQKCCRK